MGHHKRTTFATWVFNYERYVKCRGVWLPSITYEFQLMSRATLDSRWCCSDERQHSAAISPWPKRCFSHNSLTRWANCIRVVLEKDVVSYAWLHRRSEEHDGCCGCWGLFNVTESTLKSRGHLATLAFAALPSFSFCQETKCLYSQNTTLQR